MKEDFLQIKNSLPIQVFYLKVGDEVSPEMKKMAEETFDQHDGLFKKLALIDDNMDCCQDLYLMHGGEIKGLNEQDVNENSAGGGAHAHLCAPSVYLDGDLGASCCPVGEKGETGETGMYEEELVIKKALDSLADSQINMASESARIFLAKEIAKDLRGAGMLPCCPF